MFGKRKARVSRSTDSSGKYPCLINSLEQLCYSILYFCIPTRLYNKIILMVYLLKGLDPASITEEAVASLVERELAEHNKPNIHISKMVVHTVILTFTLFVCMYKHSYWMYNHKI